MRVQIPGDGKLLTTGGAAGVFFHEGVPLNSFLFFNILGIDKAKLKLSLGSKYIDFYAVHYQEQVYSVQE